MKTVYGLCNLFDKNCLALVLQLVLEPTDCSHNPKRTLLGRMCAQDIHIVGMCPNLPMSKVGFAARAGVFHIVDILYTYNSR